MKKTKKKSIGYYILLTFIILLSISLLLLIVGFIYKYRNINSNFVNNEPVTKKLNFKNLNEDSSKQNSEISLSTYKNTIYGIKFDYPNDWKLKEDKEIKLVSVEKNNYIWEIQIDPMITGGGFGYAFDGLFPSSEVRIDEVIINGKAMKMVNFFHDIFDHELLDTNKRGVWGFGVLWSKYTENGEDNVFGFGTGNLWDTQGNDYYSIIYSYDIWNEIGDPDWNMLPQKTNSEFIQMMQEMHSITNSIELLK
jgi:hypothetical protein